MQLVILTVILFSVSGQKNIMLPNERLTLDDCHLRFHKLGYVGPPAFPIGHPARLKEFAHMGAIGWVQQNGTVQWNCGGTLIWSNFVLTAAHCAVDYSNRSPDVVRFGDLNIYSSEDDAYAQQLRIIKIIRHPEHRFSRHYHDIALLILEHNVVLHDTVAPACLWTDKEVRFKALEATGWGRTGVAEKQTPVLLKVTLKPIDNLECSQYYTNETSRKLRSGLKDHHICAVDKLMDTCEGDSGGPLQIKLLHNSRVTPFLVGITSFGMACGTSMPGVYTKVAPYHDWIVATMQQHGAIVDGSTYNATLCALRYVAYREYEDAVILNRTDTFVSVDYRRRSVPDISFLPQYIVNLKWYSGVQENCHGVIIDEDTVLTVAECATSNGLPVTHVSQVSFSYGQQTVNVTKIHIHPEYIRGSGYHNIAILRLEKMLNLNSIDPTCIWHGTDLPNAADVYGFGRQDINVWVRAGETPNIDPSVSFLKPPLAVQNSTSCVISKNHVSKLHRGLGNEHICIGNNIFLVPGACELMIGGPFQDTVRKVDNDYPMTFGLNQFGRDCGFGEHAVATSLASHVEWMKTVLLPAYPDTNSALHFLDLDRHEGDACESTVGQPSQCVPVAMCLGKWKEFLTKGTVQFCSTSSVICCPLEDISSNRSRIHYDLMNCPNLVKSLNPKSFEGSMVFITSDGSLELGCLGSILTKTIILTSASCLENTVPHFVQLVANVTKRIYEVDGSLDHHAFNSTDSSNDIALVRLREALVWSSAVFPSCIWTNTTHSPLVLRLISPPIEKWNELVLSMYNSDCQRTHIRNVLSSQICAKNPQRSFTCVTGVDHLRWDREDGVSFIVGLATDEPDCVNWYYMLFTRVSAFAEWIGDNLT